MPDVEAYSLADLKTLASKILQLKVKHSLLSDTAPTAAKSLVETTALTGIEERKKKLEKDAGAVAEKIAPQELEQEQEPSSLPQTETPGLNSGNESETEQVEERAGTEEQRHERGQQKTLGEEPRKHNDKDHSPPATFEESVVSAEAEQKHKESPEELKAQITALEAQLEKAIESEEYDLAGKPPLSASFLT